MGRTDERSPSGVDESELGLWSVTGTPRGEDKGTYFETLDVGVRSEEIRNEIFVVIFETGVDPALRGV
jgi:hypothetical protein